MNDIAIYGAGGFGKEVACLIRKINESSDEPLWNLIGFFDDDPEKKGKMVSHFGPCLGGMDALNEWPVQLAVTIPIGSPNSILSVFEKIHNRNIYFPNVIHPSVVFNDTETFSIGHGNIIQADCSFSCDNSVGDFNVFNGGVVCGHDVKIGSFNTFMPALRISGEVSIGDCNFFGIGSIVLQKVKIGNNIRLGAGSVLISKTKDGYLYVGNPARKLDI